MSSKILKSQLAHVDFLVSAAGTEVLKITWLLYNCVQFNVNLKSKTKAEPLKTVCMCFLNKLSNLTYQ